MSKYFFKAQKKLINSLSKLEKIEERKPTKLYSLQNTNKFLVLHSGNGSKNDSIILKCFLESTLELTPSEYYLGRLMCSTQTVRNLSRVLPRLSGNPLFRALKHLEKQVARFLRVANAKAAGQADAAASWTPARNHRVAHNRSASEMHSSESKRDSKTRLFYQH